MTKRDPFSKQDRLSTIIDSEQNPDIKNALKLAVDQDINLIDAENIISDTKQIVVHGKIIESTPF